MNKIVKIINVIRKKDFFSLFSLQNPKNKNYIENKITLL